MTTPNIEELILKLRGQAYTTCRPDQLCDQAADLLQSQAERIKELEEEIGGWREDQKENIGVAFALQREVNKITSERDELREKYTDTYWALDDAARENTSLRAQLAESISNHEACKSANTMLLDEIAAIDATEPVAEVGGTFTLYWVGSGPIEPIVKKYGIKVGDKLFTRPMPAQDVTKLVEALEMIVSTHQGHCEHHVGVSKHSYNLADIAEEALSKYKGAK